MPLSSPASLLVNLLSPAPDWPALLEPAAWSTIRGHAPRQGVAPAIAFVARNHLKGDERAWCDRTLTHSWQRHDSSIRQLSAIIGLLNEAGIRSLALKGPLLALRHYSPPFLRKPSTDLDLAVRLPDIEKASRILQGAGYQIVMSLAEAVLTNHHHVTFTHTSRLKVELHFRLTQAAPGLPVEAFFERALPFRINSGPCAWVLNPADQLMHLILHLVGDRFALLFHSWEVRRLWQAASPDLRQQVLDKIVESHFAGAFRLCNTGVQSIWGEPLVPWNSRLPRTWLQSCLNEKMFRNLTATAGHGHTRPLSVRLRGRWLDLQITDRPSDAVRCLATMARVGINQLRRRNWRTGRIP